MLSLALAFAAGLLTSLSPCVLPVIPVVVGGALTQHRLGPVALCAGLGLSFALLGTGAALATQAFGFDAAVLRTGGAVVLLAFGVILLWPRAQQALSGILAPFASWAGRSGPRTGSGLPAQFFAGAALGAIWSPCAGPTLGAAVGLATQAGTAPQGLLLMIVFATGACLPLLAVSYGARAAFIANRDRLIALGQRAKPVFGAVLLVVAAGILSGVDKRIEAAVLDRLPDGWVDLTTKF